MKRWVLVLVVVLLLLAAGAYGYYKYATKMAPSTSQQQSSGGVFGSIKDALSKSLSLECHFTSEQGVATVAYLKLGAVHVDTNTGKSDAASFILKDKKMYFWQVSSKQGTMMTVPDVTVTPSTGVKPTGSEDKSADVMGELEKFKESCKPAVVADSLFTPPADVKFTDMSQMMKMVPSGTPTGSGMSQEDIQKMMQQYKPTGTSY